MNRWANKHSQSSQQSNRCHNRQEVVITFIDHHTATQKAWSPNRPIHTYLFPGRDRANIESDSKCWYLFQELTLSQHPITCTHLAEQGTDQFQRYQSCRKVVGWIGKRKTKQPTKPIPSAQRAWEARPYRGASNWKSTDFCPQPSARPYVTPARGRHCFSL